MADPLATLDAALAQLQVLRTLLSPGQPISIETPAALDAALTAAAPGAVLTLSTTLVYPQPLELTKSVTLWCAAVGTPVRMTLDEPAPHFLGGLTLTGPDIVLRGLDIRHTDPNAELLVVTGAHAILDRCRVLGDPTTGAHRGIRAHGPSMKILRCYVDHVFAGGQDTQAVAAWDTPGPLLIDDCYLSAAGETIMFGGADASSAANIPSDITITNCTITKRPEWFTPAISTKNTIELKCCRRVKILNNVIEYSWLAGQSGQKGSLFMITPRNQDGSAPFSVVEDIEIAHNTGGHASTAFVLAGTDDGHQSGWLQRLAIHDNVFTDFDPAVYTGEDKLIEILGGPIDVTIDKNTFAGKNMGSQVYFAGTPPCVRLAITNNQWMPSQFGVFGDGMSVGPQAFATFAPGGTLSGNMEVAA